MARGGYRENAGPRKNGGARPGAGRPPGVPNIRKRLTVEDLEKARSTGEMPHEFLLRVARGEVIQMNTAAGPVEYRPSFGERVNAAINAAPYFVPRLNAIEAKIEQTQRFEIKSAPLSELEWQQMYGSNNGLGTAGGTTEGAD